MKQTPKKQIQMKKRPAPAIATALPAGDGSYDDFAGFVDLMREQLHRVGGDIRTDLQGDLEGFLAEASEQELFFMSFALSIWNGQRTHGQQRGPEELAEAFRLAGDDLPAGAENTEDTDREVHAHMTADGVTLSLTTKCRRQPRARSAHA